MKKNLLTTLRAQQLRTWFPVIVLMLIAVFIRFRLTGHPVYYLLAGGDGPYAPLQARSLLETGGLAFPDMPLLFVFQAETARLLQFFCGLSQSDAVLSAIRLIDIVIPPLAAIPVFLIVREMKQEGGKVRLAGYLVVAFALLNFTPVISFAGQLQKNGVAVIWVFFYLYFIGRIMKYHSRRDGYFAFSMLLLCALTHFGSFSILLFFTLVLLLFYTVKKSIRASRSRKTMLCSVGGLLLLLGILAFFDPVRFVRLLEIPLRLFESPVLLLVLDGQNVAGFVNPITLIGANLLWIFALISLLRNRKHLEVWRKTLAWAFLVIACCMSSPLIGIEWANRLYLMSYIPLTMVYAVLFSIQTSFWRKLLPGSLMVILLLFSVAMSFGDRSLSITDEAYAEFTKMPAVKFPANSAIVARQDLRLLGSWCFRTKGIADYKVTVADFRQFDALYCVRQKNGSNLTGPRYKQADLPANAEKVYSGAYFELYRIPDSKGWTIGNGRPPRISGKVLSVSNDRIIIRNERSGTNRAVRFQLLCTLR